jgi:hypothetical protein
MRTRSSLSLFARTTEALLRTAFLLIGIASPTPSQAAQVEFSNTFDMATDPAFRDYRKVVTDYVRHRGGRRPGEVCVIGLVDESGWKQAWVIWPKGRQIILWEGNEPDLSMTRGRIRIPKDVVKDESEVRGSTYLVTQAWVDGLTAACDERGRKLRIPQQNRN